MCKRLFSGRISSDNAMVFMWTVYVSYWSSAVGNDRDNAMTTYRFWQLAQKSALRLNHSHASVTQPVTFAVGLETRFVSLADLYERL